MKLVRLMTLAPGHFHAALVQRTMPPGVHRRSYVYAPLDGNLTAHIDRVAAFNARSDDPTNWELDVRAGADYLDRFLREQPGNTAVLSGRNRPKIDLIRLAVTNNLHVLADKPWVVEAADYSKLEELIRDADQREVLAWDMMTERHEVTSRLQRELIRDQDIFGDWQRGEPAQPGLVLASVHYLRKTVADRPLRRPWWWFDAAVSGEAMADVGTHLADLALWLAFPDQPIDRREVQMLDADRWPLVLTSEQFGELTGLPEYPPELAARTVSGQLYYAGNNWVTFAIRGLHVRLETRWEYDSPGGDTHAAAARGTRATVGVRQEPGRHPELFVTAVDAADQAELVQDLRLRCDQWRYDFPGLTVDEQPTRARLVIPDRLRIGHEAHFTEVVEQFVRYFNTPRAIPPWERVNLLTKYHITTQAVELGRRKRQF